MSPAFAAGIEFEIGRVAMEPDSAFVATASRIEATVYLAKSEFPMMTVDTGCASMMAGRDAIEDYVGAAMSLGAAKPVRLPSKKSFHVANGQVTQASEKIILPGWCGGNDVKYECDVGPWRNVPVLLSISVLREMRAILELRPLGEESWLRFGNSETGNTSPYKDQQLVDLPQGLLGFRPCIVDPDKEARVPNGGKNVCWLTAIGPDIVDGEIDVEFTDGDDWEGLLDPATWWPPPLVEDEVTYTSFEQEEYDYYFVMAAVFAAVKDEIYNRIMAGECEPDEIILAIKVAHENLGHTRNIEKLMRLFPPTSNSSALIPRRKLRYYTSWMCSRGFHT